MAPTARRRARPTVAIVERPEASVPEVSDALTAPSLSELILTERKGASKDLQSYSLSRATFSRIGRQIFCCDWVKAVVSSGVM
jgi:hypothetical protein